MDTLTVDVRNFPNEKIQELERLIEHWKQQQRMAHKKRKEKEIVFAIHDSDVIGGEFKRANGYE